jgi:cytochrome c556
MVMLFAFIVTTGVITCGWKCSKALGEDIGNIHRHKSTPTRTLMQLISSHTSKILDAIMIGDFNAVTRESNAVAENSEIIMEMFFSADGKAGEWFKPAGNNPKAAEEMKDEFEKYLKVVIDTSRNIAETAGKKNIVETYKSFDAMLQKACFTCHEVSREKWPDWPDFMRISGG